MPILCLTAKPETAQRLMLSYGVRSVVTPDIHSFSQMVERAAKMARVVQSLVDNAVRYTPEGGAVVVTERIAYPS